MIDTTDMSTGDVLRIASEFAKEHSIGSVVVATTRGGSPVLTTPK